MNKDRELKPCPFCGEKAEIYMGDGISLSKVWCRNCRVSTGNFKSDIKAISAWNKRSYKPLGKEELEEIIGKEINKWEVKPRGRCIPITDIAQAIYKRIGRE